MNYQELLEGTRMLFVNYLNKICITVVWVTILGFPIQASGTDNLHKHIKKKQTDITHRDYSSNFNVFVLDSFLEEKRKLCEQKKWKDISLASVNIQNINGNCRLKLNDTLLNGLYNIELSDNFYFAGTFKNGILDGIAVGYYGSPYPIYFSFGEYRDGIPFNGSFFFFPEKGGLFSYRLLHYKKGTFCKITNINSSLAPFTNELDEQGKIINGYDLINFYSPNNIIFLEVKNGIKIQQVNIKFFEKSGFSDRLAREHFKTILVSAKDNREKSKMLNQKK